MLIRPASPATQAWLMSTLAARAVLIFLVMLPVPAACKRKAGPGAAPSARASARLAGGASSAHVPLPGSSEQPSRCRRLPGWALSLDPEAQAPAPAEHGDAGDDEARLPFGVTTGGALTLRSGFAVAGIRGEGQAFVALLGEHQSRRVDLGQLHGDVEVPALAADGERVIVALRSSDAAGFTVKLGQIAAALGGVEWGFELSQLGRAISSLDVAVSGERGVLVLEGEDKQRASRVLLGSFAAKNLKQPFEVKPFEAKDVELPRLIARPGGYWLTWVRALPEPKQAPRVKADAGSEDPEERELLELLLRVVEVVKLDEQGRAQGAALRLGQPRRQEVLFDVAPLESGGLLVATRSDTAIPGVESGALMLSVVQPDGSVTDEPLEDDDIGAGAPVLLVDAATPLQPWLAVSSTSDATRLGSVRGARTFLQTDSLLAGAEPIAVRGSDFLTQRVRGRSVELETLHCELLLEPPARQK
jgi:hypothetical protein